MCHDDGLQVKGLRVGLLASSGALYCCMASEAPRQAAALADTIELTVECKRISAPRSALRNISAVLTYRASLFVGLGVPMCCGLWVLWTLGVVCGRVCSGS